VEPPPRPSALAPVFLALALLAVGIVVSPYSTATAEEEQRIYMRPQADPHLERVRSKLIRAKSGRQVWTRDPTLSRTRSPWRGRRWMPAAGAVPDVCRSSGCESGPPSARKPPESGERSEHRPQPPNVVPHQAGSGAAPAGGARPAAPDAPTGGPALGTQFHCTQTQYNNAERVAVLEKLKAAGVSWVRIDVGWGGIEDSGKGARNGWYIGMVDFCVEEARKRGLNVLVMLWLTPRWANGGQAERVPPTNPQDYADFARWAAERWRGKVQAWEIWNETVLNAFWLGTEAQYAALLKAAYPAIKAGDPAAKVVFAGMSHNDDAYLRRLYALGVKGSFDVVATHPYQGLGDAPPEHPDDGNRWWLTHVPAVRKVMVEHGDGGKPIWFTEFGWSAHANWPGIANWQRGVTPEQQADYAVRALRHTQANYPYVQVMFWYKERAHPQGNLPYHEGRALLGSDLSERPVYRALRSYLTGS
jgi:hypothetical protein